MKRIVLLLAAFVLSAIFPQTVFASTCADANDIGKTFCTCDDGAVQSELPGSSFTADSCNSGCWDNGSDSWALSECVDPDPTDPTIDPIDQDNVSDPTLVNVMTTTDTAAPATKAPDFVTPNLNVPIPGFEKDGNVNNGFISPTQSADKTSVSVNFLADYINAIYGWILGAAALVAVVMMMIGGLQYIMARGKSKYIEAAKTRITNAITGMVLLLAAYSLASLIDPRLVNPKSLTVQYVPYIFVSTEDTGSDVAALTLPDPAGGTNGVPYYSQRSYNDIYGASCSGSPTIKSSGCGPTSAAMVLSFYGVSADPVSTAAAFEADGYRVCGSGTAYAAFSNSSIIKNNGLVGKSIPINQHSVIEGYLAENKPIIISVGKSRFTNGGHFMVLTGINSDGDFMLNDPNSGYKTATKDEIYDAIKFAVYISKK